MAEEKKDQEKISDITSDQELEEKEMDDVSGGVLYKTPRTFASKDCSSNCMGSVPTATGKEIDV